MNEYPLMAAGALLYGALTGIGLLVAGFYAGDMVLVRLAVLLFAVSYLAQMVGAVSVASQNETITMVNWGLVVLAILVGLGGIVRLLVVGG